MDVEEGAFILAIELEDEEIFINEGKLLSSSWKQKTNCCDMWQIWHENIVFFKMILSCITLGYKEALESSKFDK